MCFTNFESNFFSLINLSRVKFSIFSKNAIQIILLYDSRMRWLFYLNMPFISVFRYLTKSLAHVCVVVENNF